MTRNWIELISKASSTELDIIIMILVEFCRIFSWSHTFLDHPPQMDPFRLQSIFQFALFIRDFHSVSLDIYICFSRRELFSFPLVKQTFLWNKQHRENCMALFYSHICVQILSCTWTEPIFSIPIIYMYFTSCKSILSDILVFLYFSDVEIYPERVFVLFDICSEWSDISKRSESAILFTMR